MPVLCHCSSFEHGFTGQVNDGWSAFYGLEMPVNRGKDDVCC